MPDSDETTLSKGIKDGRKEATATADKAISGLAGVADNLGMQETAGKLRDAERELNDDTFKFVVMGRFKNGKSTLLNALLGGTTHAVQLGDHKGPMVVNDLPATATLTGVRYAEEPFVNAIGFDGSKQEWTFGRYLDESTLDIDEQESQRRFQDIREFEMGFPAVLCKEGVVVYDSPGLDEHQARTLITRDATTRCDAAIIVYRSDVLMGEGELVSAAEVVADGTKLFTVVNLMGNRQPDDRLRGFVWNKYVRDQMGGANWNNQDLSQRDIYFVNAERARDGRYEDDDEEVEVSGLADFERALMKFLLNDRLGVHLEKFVTLSTNLSKSIDLQISQRQVAARGDREKLKAAYAEAEPKLAAIRARPGRLAKIIEQYRSQAEATVARSFARMVARIQNELPAHLAATELPSAKKMTAVWQQKKMQEEAATVVSDFVRGNFDRWGNHDVKAELRPVLERLTDDIEEEVAAVAREFDEIRVNLGWSGPGAVGSVISTTERVAAAVAGLVFGDFVGAATGGAGGLRGAAGSIGGALGAAIVLGLLGITAAPVLIPVALVAALLGGAAAGRIGLERRVKEKTLEAVMPALARMPAENEAGILQEVSGFFKRIESTATGELTAVIEEEERGIKHTVELNQREQEDREAALDELAKSAAAVADYRVALQRALVLARQTV